MQDLTTRQLLFELMLISRRLRQLGGPDADGDLFERVLDLQDRVLERFGLPQADSYLALLPGDVPGHIGAVDAIFDELSRASRECGARTYN